MLRDRESEIEGKMERNGYGERGRERWRERWRLRKRWGNIEWKI